MRKHLFIKAIAVAATTIASITAQADDFNLYYTTSEASSATKIEAAANLDKIVFTDGSIKVIKTDGSSTLLEQSSIAKLFFSTEKTVTAIEDAPQSSADGASADDIVRDTTGRVIATRGNMKSLPQGVYIIKGKKIIIK